MKDPDYYEVFVRVLICSLLLSCISLCFTLPSEMRHSVITRFNTLIQNEREHGEEIEKMYKDIDKRLGVIEGKINLLLNVHTYERRIL